MQKPAISVRRRSTLAQTIRTENWLHDMAQKGFFLRQLSGTNYWFEQGEPGDVRYFLMSPEIGFRMRECLLRVRASCWR